MGILEALERIAEHHGTPRKTSCVPEKSPPLLGCTLGTPRTSQITQVAHVPEVQAANDPPPVAVVRKRFTDACTTLHLNAVAVVRQFDAWRYTAADLVEMQGWPDSTVQAHARLLVREIEQGIQP